jgi:S1-C subfamily serine protease
VTAAGLGRRRIGVALLGAALLPAAGSAQAEPPGLAAPLGQREPRTPLERVIASKLPSIVKVHGASGVATIRPYAAGVIVSDQGHVLTADLIMIQPGQTRVVLHDGTVYPADLLPAHEELGVRMLKIDAPGKTLVPQVMPERADWPHGTLVVSLGNCYRLAEFSEKVSATFGVLTARARTGLRYRLSDVDYDGELLITDAPNNPGHEGGGLFTLAGDWIGLNTRLVESVETNTQISAAIPTTSLRDYIRRCVTGEPAAEVADAEGTAQRGAYHGIVLFERGLHRSPPAYVERVERGSPAAELGLRPDDLLVRIDNAPIRSCADFHRAAASLRPGATVQVTYKRGTQVLRGSMTLAEAKR